MGIKKISQLDSLDAITDDTEIPVLVGGVTKRYKPGLPFNIRAFGASPSATAAVNTAAIQAAIDAAEAAGGGIVHFPPGTFVHNGVTVNDANVWLRGSGPETELQCTTGDGITYTGTSGDFFCWISDMRLTTQAAGVGRAIYVNFTTATGLNSQHANIRNVVIDRALSGAGFWSTGIQIHNARNSVVTNVHVAGRDTGAKTLFAYRVTGEATDVRFTSCQFVEVDVGWSIEGTVEGTMLTNCVGVRARIGVSKSHSAGEPWLGMSHCHLNCSLKCIELSNTIQSFIDSCLLYGEDHGTSTNWTGLEIGGASAADIIVSNTQFLAPSHSNSRTAIDINAGARYQLVNLKFKDLNTALDVAAGVTSVSVLGSQYVGVITRLIDATAGTVRLIDIGSDGNWEIASNGNTFVRIRGATAAFLRLIDESGAVDNEIVDVFNNDGVLQIRQVNDDGSVKRTVLSIGLGGQPSLYVNGALSAIDVGVADSGGIGFKLLRVPN